MLSIPELRVFAASVYGVSIDYAFTLAQLLRVSFQMFFFFCNTICIDCSWFSSSCALISYSLVERKEFQVIYQLDFYDYD